MAITLSLVCGVSAVIYIQLDCGYYYSDGGPPQPGSIAMATGPSGAVYFVWDVGQWECGGHNMQGVWLGKVDGVTNEFLWRKRISEDCCPYDPVIAVNKSEIIFVVWIDGKDNGAVTNSEGDVLKTLEIEDLRYSGMPLVLNIDQWENLHLKYMEDYPDQRTRILDPEGSLLSIEDPYSPVYNQTYQLNNNSTSRYYSGLIDIKGEDPVYLLDSEGNTWIASVNSEAYITIANVEGVKLVDGGESWWMVESWMLSLKATLDIFGL
jgi:hypothetical protein